MGERADAGGPSVNVMEVCMAGGRAETRCGYTAKPLINSPVGMADESEFEASVKSDVMFVSLPSWVGMAAKRKFDLTLKREPIWTSMPSWVGMVELSAFTPSSKSELISTIKPSSDLGGSGWYGLGG